VAFAWTYLLRGTEFFIHGKVSFWREEWEGFREAVGPGTKVVGVKIRDDSTLKLFRDSDTPILRGSAYIRHENSAYLRTRGWTPRLATYPGMAAMAGLLAIFAEFEREILRERTRAGLAQARLNGKRLGRPATAALHTAEIRKLQRAGVSKGEIARRLRVGRTSVRRILKEGGPKC
jgi:hypothetical protein